jgi:hypothetical protein
VQFGCASLSNAFLMSFPVSKPKKCDGETHIQTAHPKRKCN